MPLPFWQALLEQPLYGFIVFDLDFLPLQLNCYLLPRIHHYQSYHGARAASIFEN
jgi:hypothetical protein